MKLITIFMTYLFISTCSYAQEPLSISGSPQEVFPVLSTLPIQSLIDKGIDDVGEINLAALKENIKQVNWSLFTLGPFLGGSGGTRDSGIYFVEDRSAVISYYALQRAVEKEIEVSTFILHEALGALGYIDDNYNYSSPLYYLSTLKGEKLQNELKAYSPLFNNIKRRTKNEVYQMNKESGGVTVVGGGGQIEIASLKPKLFGMLDVFIKVEEIDSNYKDKFVTAISNVRIENLSIERVIEIVNNGNNLEDKITYNDGILKVDPYLTAKEDIDIIVYLILSKIYAKIN